MNKEKQEYREEILWDIPSHLKIYHQIEYDAESNSYNMYGHESADDISLPQYVNIDSRVRIKTSHKNHRIVDLDFGCCVLTLYPLSTFLWIRKGD